VKDSQLSAATSLVVALQQQIEESNNELKWLRTIGTEQAIAIGIMNEEKMKLIKDITDTKKALENSQVRL
jgi:hypothetical protein